MIIGDSSALVALSVMGRLDLLESVFDVMHILLAQKAKCKKLITFDDDFRKFDGFNGVKVEVL